MQVNFQVVGNRQPSGEIRILSFMKLFGKQLETTVDEIIEASEGESSVKDVLSSLLSYCRHHQMQCDMGEARRIVKSKMGLREQFDALVRQALNE